MSFLTLLEYSHRNTILICSPPCRPHRVKTTIRHASRDLLIIHITKLKVMVKELTPSEHLNSTARDDILTTKTPCYATKIDHSWHVTVIGMGRVTRNLISWTEVPEYIPGLVCRMVFLAWRVIIQLFITCKPNLITTIWHHYRKVNRYGDNRSEIAIGKLDSLRIDAWNLILVSSK